MPKKNIATNGRISLASILFRSVFVSAVFFIFYFFLILWPAITIQHDLNTAKKNISQKYFSLIKIKTTISNLTKLNPESELFYGKNRLLVENIKQTITGGVQSEKAVLPEKKGFSFGLTEQKTFLYSTFPEIWDDLNKKNTSILVKEQPIIENLTSFNNVLDIVFTYNPKQELEDISVWNRYDELIAKIQSGRERMEDVKKNLEQHSISKKRKDQLLESISDFDKQMQNVSFFARQKSRVSFLNALNNVQNSYNTVKKSSYIAELSLIRSKDSIEIITRHTNLILEYKFWLEKIDELQKKTL
ncbi:MAG: hypothetical protein COU27_03520 [Candidatus Levybacteria bacterium CG10_big_fil_rev_8_21_14_0_10_36_7]|nr:MAG: hypothetical protein COU27_03520 [Candidatus Levybacteria bacterium CG10_big_fil_rev_8_21_14_0_10_36_7]